MITTARLAMSMITVMALIGCGGSDVDLAAERAALMQADRQFSLDTDRYGGDGWADTFLKDGVMFPPKGRVEGRDKIREIMLPVFDGDYKMKWEPTSAVVAASGDIGYTMGRWQSSIRSSSGQDSVAARGNYVTIWRKQPGFGWRVAVDIGNPDPQLPQAASD